MNTTEQIADLFDRMGYVVIYAMNYTIELQKPDFTDWTDRELDTLYDEASRYESVRVSSIIDEGNVAQVEVGV